MTTISDLKQSPKGTRSVVRHLDTDLVKVARFIPVHRAGILLCDEKHVHVYTTAGTFSIEWIDWEYGKGPFDKLRTGTNHEATAAAIEAKLAAN